MITNYLSKKGLNLTDIWFHEGCILNGASFYSDPNKEVSAWINSAKNYLAYKRKKYIEEGTVGAIFIPIKGLYGNVVGVVTRKIGDVKNKHDSSPMKKGQYLFNLSNAYKDILRNDSVYVVEGSYDAIKLNKEGLTNTVSMLGTTLTANHMCLLLRFTKNITLVLDNDQAGFDGVKKIMQEYSTYANFHYTRLDTDPDEFVHKYGVQTFLKSVHSQSSDLKNNILGRK